MRESLFLVDGVRSLSIFFFPFWTFIFCFFVLCFFVFCFSIVLTLFFTSLLSYWEGKLSALCP